MKASKTWNQQEVKKENKAIVLEKIIEHAPISRADIANVTGLNKGTVSSLANELLHENLIKESGPGKSSGGRRPVMLLFNHAAGYSIGIDIGVNYILGVLTDLTGEIQAEEHTEFEDISYEEVLNKLFEIIDLLIAAAPESTYGIVGIGIGVPGIVNKDYKIMLAPNLQWRNINLKPVVEERYQLPVIIENEANAGAYGEKNFGAGKDYQDIVYISVGMGIGVGLILNGKLYKGNNGFSGEFGHMTIDVNGAKCSCGNQGCWELYASERALIKEAGRAGLKLGSDRITSLEGMIQLAMNENPQSLEVFGEIGKYLGAGINNIIHAFNPEQVIIGNRMASAENWLKTSIIEWIGNQTLWFSQQDLRIDFSDLHTHSTALGVAAFTTENFLSSHLESEHTSL